MLTKPISCFLQLKIKKVVGEEPKISIENRDIERVYKTKFLGVVIDSKLNWRYHIDYIYIANRISKKYWHYCKGEKHFEFENDKGFILFVHISIFELLLCVGSSMYYLFVRVAYNSETYCKVDFE